MKRRLLPGSFADHRVQCPQQSNNKDCGIFVLAFAEALAARRDVNDLTNIPAMRTVFSALLATSAEAVPGVLVTLLPPSVLQLRSQDRAPGLAPFSTPNGYEKMQKAFNVCTLRVTLLAKLLRNLHMQHQAFLRRMGLINSSFGCQGRLDSVVKTARQKQEAGLTEFNALLGRFQAYPASPGEILEAHRRMVEYYNAAFDTLLHHSRQYEEHRWESDGIAARIKACIVLCRVFGPRYLKERAKLQRVEKLQESFFAMADVILEELT